MTDVPFVAFTLLALLCYVRAMRRESQRRSGGAALGMRRVVSIGRSAS